jgi:hypothetical protein
MTSARRPLDRMTCPTCGRQVAFRLIRAPRVNRGRYGAIPGIRQPVRHKRLLDDGTLGPICEPAKGNIGYLVRGAGL